MAKTPQTPLQPYRQALWPLPPTTRTDKGKARRVGVEIEFTGLDIDPIVEIIQGQFGGEPRGVSDYEVIVENTRFGDFGVELDFAYIKNLSRERRNSEDSNDFEELTETIVGAIAKQLVPFEVVAPPIAMDQLWQLEDLFKALRKAGAEGTHGAATNAFGLQLNPEMPDCEPATILNYLRAFVCLFDWLKKRTAVDISRRITSYIDPFGKDYLRLILAEDYRPDNAQLIDDYIDHNPTRNRALDMLPLFTHIDEARLRARIDDERVKARPTLHYRLPNSLIDSPEWGLITPWRDWLQVEALASDGDKLTALCKAYREHLNSTTSSLFKDWRERSTAVLIPELL